MSAPLESNAHQALRVARAYSESLCRSDTDKRVFDSRFTHMVHVVEDDGSSFMLQHAFPIKWRDWYLIISESRDAHVVQEDKVVKIEEYVIDHMPLLKLDDGHVRALGIEDMEPTKE